MSLAHAENQANPFVRKKTLDAFNHLVMQKTGYPSTAARICSWSLIPDLMVYLFCLVFNQWSDATAVELPIVIGF